MKGLGSYARKGIEERVGREGGKRGKRRKRGKRGKKGKREKGLTRIDERAGFLYEKGLILTEREGSL